MNLTTPLDGFPVVALALATLLSAIVSLIASSARRQAIIMAQASARDLAELTGILDYQDLQDTFGPPNLNRMWQTLTLERVQAERRPLGVLMSAKWLDWTCIVLALLAFFSSFALVEIGLLVAFTLQLASWLVASRLPR